VESRGTESLRQAASAAETSTQAGEEMTMGPTAQKIYDGFCYGLGGSLAWIISNGIAKIIAGLLAGGAH
jgi:hypothetical protein